jgi:hypothetical protein
MVSTSAFEIGFAAAETVDVPADAADGPAAVAVDGAGAEVPFAEPADGEAAEEPAAAVTLAACLEPKMADTMLPKTLLYSGPRPASRRPGRRFCPRGRLHKLRSASLSFGEPMARGILSQIHLT